MKLSDVLAVVAVVISLFSATYGYLISRRAHQVSTYYGVINFFREIDRIFIDYPDIRPYFYDGKPVDVNDPNYQRVRAVAEHVLDVFEWIWHRRDRLYTEGETGWIAYIVESFKSSPALQQHYMKSASWYPGITQLIADHKITLTEGGKPPTTAPSR